MLLIIIIYLNQFSRQNYLKIPKVSEYSLKFPIFPVEIYRSQNSREFCIPSYENSVSFPFPESTLLDHCLKKIKQHCETYEPTDCYVRKLHNLCTILHNLCTILNKLCIYFLHNSW